MQTKSYLNRIHYHGITKTDLPTLSDLQRQHLLSVPFENLAIHRREPITLDIQQLYHKIVHHNQGGFCYELNGLFYWLLARVGFEVRYVSARVATGSGGYGPECDHMALLVILDKEEYLVDVGFGEFAFAPLLLKDGLIQHDARGDFVLTEIDAGWQVDKVIDGQRHPEYRLTTTPRALSDFADMCAYHQTSPDSHFTQKRLITRPTANGRITLSGNTLTVKENGKKTERILADKVEFSNIFIDYFGVTF